MKEFITENIFPEFECDYHSKSPSFFIKDSKYPFDLSSDYLDKLEMLAHSHPTGRSRLCLHQKNSSLHQEMIIAMSAKSYIPPHRQPGRKKSYSLIRGELKVHFFTSEGILEREVHMRTAEYSGPSYLFFSSDIYHMPVAVTNMCIYLEILEGAYDQQNFHVAPWV